MMNYKSQLLENLKNESFRDNICEVDLGDMQLNESVFYYSLLILKKFRLN